MMIETYCDDKNIRVIFNTKMHPLGILGNASISSKNHK